MKRILTTLIMGLAGAALYADTCAFTYQACLRDEKGAIIKDGEGNVRQNHVVEIRLYKEATGGTALWGRSYPVLTDANGLFNVAVTDDAGTEIVSAKLADVLKTVQPGGLYLGLTVQGSSGEIVPRQCIYAAPFAAVANDVRAVSGSITVGGSITFGSGSTQVVISKDGITQAGSKAQTQVQTLVVNSSASVGGTLTAGGGVLTADGSGVTVKDHPLNVKDTQLQINGSEVVPVPVGGIIMWTKPALPDTTHWAICNGANGTPDLSGRFIVGVGKSANGATTYTAGATGGEETHTLTVNEMPSHAHQMLADEYYRNTNGGKDSETKLENQDGSKGSDNCRWRTNTFRAGGDGAHENRPPYYALYYIMRIK